MLELQDIKKLNEEIEELNKKNDDRRTDLKALTINFDNLLESYNKRYGLNITANDVESHFEMVSKEIQKQYEDARGVVESIKNGTYKKVPVTEVLKEVTMEIQAETGANDEVKPVDILDIEACNTESSMMSFATDSIGEIESSDEESLFVNEDEKEEKELVESVVSPVITKPSGFIAIDDEEDSIFAKPKTSTKPPLQVKPSVEGSNKAQEQFWNNFSAKSNNIV